MTLSVFNFFTKRFSALVLVAILTLVGTIAWGQLLFDQGAGVRALESEVTLESEQQQATARFHSQLRQSGPEAAMISALFLHTAEQKAEFLEQIEELASQAKVTYDLHNAVEDEFLRLHFSATGPFSNVLYFALLVESLPYEIKFDQVELAVATAAVGKNSLSAWRGDFVAHVLTVKP